MKTDTIFLIVILFFVCLFSGNAQFNGTLGYDNYAGIYNVLQNPAHAAESRHVLDINTLTFHGTGYTDYGSLPFVDIREAPNGLDTPDYPSAAAAALSVNQAFENKDFFLPSVTFSLSSKHAIGLTNRSRTFTNYDNFSGPLWQGFSSGFPAFSQDTFAYNLVNYGSTTHHWKELGLTYAAVLLSTRNHFIKVGGTAKYLMGNGVVHLGGTALNGTFDQTSDDLNLNGDLSYFNTFPQPEGTIDPTRTVLDDPSLAGNLFDNLTNFESIGNGIGGDIGFVYEYRPRSTNRQGRGKNIQTFNKYKVQLSASLMDMGLITYKDVRVEQFLIENATLEGDQISVDGIVTSLTINPQVTPIPITEDREVYLPTSLRIGLDYYLKPGWDIYINLNYIGAVSNTNNLYQNNVLDRFTVTPRYETPKFSAYLPLSYDDLSGTSLGIGVRWGPLLAGSSSMLSDLFTDLGVQHFFLGVHLPLLAEDKTN